MGDPWNYQCLIYWAIPQIIHIHPWLLEILSFIKIPSSILSPCELNNNVHGDTHTRPILLTKSASLFGVRKHLLDSLF